MKIYETRIDATLFTRSGPALLLCALVTLLTLWSAGVARAAVPWLSVSGNRIVNPSGQTVCLRGFSLLPAQHNNECHYCNTTPIKTVIDMATNSADGWYPRILRIGVTGKDGALSDPATLFSKYLDPYVQHAIAKGVYVIVDLHLVADYDAGSGSGVKQQTVLNFWNYVAPLYANTPNVIFEVFNEPINPDNWTSWKNYIQPVVDSIRAVAPNNLIFMGGPQWSTRVNRAVTDPILGSNIVYVYHIYPNQGAASTTNLDSKFGNAANTIPVVISEFGWNPKSKYSNGVTTGTTSAWGAPFRAYMDARPHISWQGYIFDNFWKPQYFDGNWNLMGGEFQGQFMKQWLFEKMNDNQP